MLFHGTSIWPLARVWQHIPTHQGSLLPHGHAAAMCHPHPGEQTPAQACFLHPQSLLALPNHHPPPPTICCLLLPGGGGVALTADQHYSCSFTFLALTHPPKEGDVSQTELNPAEDNCSRERCYVLPITTLRPQSNGS